jgi:hypothetical protein
MAEADTAIIIIGAGVVGLSTALYLRRSGRDVVVIDPLPPPGGASFGNAGMISADTSVPIALPDMLRKVPSWLTDPLGPLAVRPSYFPKALPWLRKWIAASRMSRVLEISDAMRALHKDAFLCWRELLGPESFSDLVRPVGQFMSGRPTASRRVPPWSAGCASARASPARHWASTTCGRCLPASHPRCVAAYWFPATATP